MISAGRRTVWGGASGSCHPAEEELDRAGSDRGGRLGDGGQAGLKRSAQAKSSNAATARSRGTRTPAARKAASVPIVMLLFAANTAVGGDRQVEQRERRLPAAFAGRGAVDDQRRVDRRGPRVDGRAGSRAVVRCWWTGRGSRRPCRSGCGRARSGGRSRPRWPSRSRRRPGRRGGRDRSGRR